MASQALNKLPIRHFRNQLIKSQGIRIFAKLIVSIAAASVVAPVFSATTCIGPSWAPNSRFVASDDTVYDKKTKLTWKRCLEGTSWLGTQCSGNSYESKQMVWSQAVEKYGVDGDGWRLPNADELASIRTGNNVKSDKVDRITGGDQSGCTDPAYNENFFGDIGSDPWTSTAGTGVNGTRVWIVDLSQGYVHLNGTNEDKAVLLVKGKKYIGAIIRSGNMKEISQDNLSKINAMDGKELERRRVRDEKVRSSNESSNRSSGNSARVFHDWPYNPALSAKSWTIRCGSGADVTITRGDGGFWHGVNIAAGSSLDQAMRKVCGE